MVGGKEECVCVCVCAHACVCACVCLLQLGRGYGTFKGFNVNGFFLSFLAGIK